MFKTYPDLSILRVYNIKKSNNPPNNNGFVFKLLTTNPSDIYLASNANFRLAWVPRYDPSLLYQPFRIYAQYSGNVLNEYQSTITGSSKFGITHIVDHSSWLVFGGSWKNQVTEGSYAIIGKVQFKDSTSGMQTFKLENNLLADLSPQYKVDQLYPLRGQDAVIALCLPASPWSTSSLLQNTMTTNYEYGNKAMLIIVWHHASSTITHCSSYPGVYKLILQGSNLQFFYPFLINDDKLVIMENRAQRADCFPTETAPLGDCDDYILKSIDLKRLSCFNNDAYLAGVTKLEDTQVLGYSYQSNVDIYGINCYSATTQKSKCVFQHAATIDSSYFVYLANTKEMTTYFNSHNEDGLNQINGPLSPISSISNNNNNFVMLQSTATSLTLNSQALLQISAIAWDPINDNILTSEMSRTVEDTNQPNLVKLTYNDFDVNLFDLPQYQWNNRHEYQKEGPNYQSYVWINTNPPPSYVTYLIDRGDWQHCNVFGGNIIANQCMEMPVITKYRLASQPNALTKDYFVPDVIPTMYYEYSATNKFHRHIRLNFLELNHEAYYRFYLNTYGMFGDFKTATSGQGYTNLGDTQNLINIGQGYKLSRCYPECLHDSVTGKPLEYVTYRFPVDTALFSSKFLTVTYLLQSIDFPSSYYDTILKRQEYCSAICFYSQDCEYFSVNNKLQIETQTCNLYSISSGLSFPGDYDYFKKTSKTALNLPVFKAGREYWSSDVVPVRLNDDLNQNVIIECVSPIPEDDLIQGSQSEIQLFSYDIAELKKSPVPIDLKTYVNQNIYIKDYLIVDKDCTNAVGCTETQVQNLGHNFQITSPHSVNLMYSEGTMGYHNFQFKYISSDCQIITVSDPKVDQSDFPDSFTVTIQQYVPSLYIPFKLYLKDCSMQELSSILQGQVLDFKFQINKKVADQDISTLFQPKLTDSDCQISEMSISGDNDKVQVQGYETLSIDSSYLSSSTFSNIEYSYDYTIVVRVNSTLVDPYQQKVNLQIGCYNYAIVNATYVNQNQQISKSTNVDLLFQIKLFKNHEDMSVERLVEFELNKIIEWEAEFNPCGPVKVSLCVDEPDLRLCREENFLKLQQNPTFLGILPLDPILVINQQSVFDKNISITAESIDKQILTIKARVKICGGEEIKKSQDQSITIRTEEFKIYQLTYDLSTFFSSTDPECPIDRFMISTSNSGSEAIELYEQNKYVQLSNNILTVQTMYPNNITFYFAAETLSKVKSFIFFDLFIGTIEKDLYKQVLADSLLMLNIPMFQTEVPNPLVLNLTMITDLTYELMFPKVINFDYEIMTIQFKNTENLPPGAQISYKQDFVFLRLVPELVTEDMLIPISVIFFAYDKFYKNNINLQIIRSRIDRDLVQYVSFEDALNGKGGINKDEEENQTDKQIYEAKGFKMNEKLGIYTFPGINPTQIESFLDDPGNDQPDPEVYIESISEMGILVLSFDQELFIPLKIDQKVYSNIFRLEVQSAIDGSIAVGKFLAYTQPEQLDEEICKDCEARHLQFYVKVIDHTPKIIQFQLDFENEDGVSNSVYGRDEIIIKILMPEMLLSSKTMKQTNRFKFGDTFVESDYIIAKGIPPQIKNKGLVRQMEESAKSSILTVTLFTTSNFLLRLIIGGSMQELWGMIRALQMILISIIVDVPIPPIAYIFFLICLEFAGMDIYQGGDILEEIFSFKETPALNDNFELFGKGNMNFYLLSDSYFLLFLSIIVYHLFKKALNIAATLNPKKKIFRKIGIWAYDEATFRSIKTSSLKFFMESYFDLLFCFFLNSIMLYRTMDEPKELKEYFTGFSNNLSSFTTLIYGLCLILFPIYGYVIITFRLESLENQEMKDNHGFLYEDIKTNKTSTALFNITFLIRRIITVLILIFLGEFPLAQCILLMFIALIDLIYRWALRPSQEEFQNNFENFNEFSIYLCSVIIISFLDATTSHHEFRDYMSYLLISVCCCNLFFNISLAVFNSFSEFYNFVLTQYMDNKIQAAIMENLQLYDLDHPQIRKVNILIAVAFCKEWKHEADWLRANEIDFQNYDEEKLYRFFVKIFYLKERALQQQVLRTVKTTKEKIIGARELSRNILNQKKALDMENPEEFSLTDDAQETELEIDQNRPIKKNSIELIPISIASKQKIKKKKIILKKVDFSNNTKPTPMILMTSIDEIEDDLNSIESQNAKSVETSFYDEESDKNEKTDEPHDVISRYSSGSEISIFEESQGVIHNEIDKSIKELIDQNALIKKLEKEASNMPGLQEEFKKVESSRHVKNLANNPLFEEKYKQRIAKKLSLGFMKSLILDSETIQEHILTVVNKTKEQRLNDYKKNDGLQSLKSTLDKSNGIQSLMQCLLQVDDYAKHFITMEDEDIASTDAEGLFVKQIADIFKIAYIEKIEFQNGQSIDIQGLCQSIADQDLKSKTISQQFEKLIQEISDNNEMIKQTFVCKQQLKGECWDNHKTKQSLTTQGLSLEKNEISVSQCLQKHFEIKPQPIVCMLCDPYNRRRSGFSQRLIKQSPSVIVLKFDNDKAQTCFSFNQTLNIDQYLKNSKTKNKSLALLSRNEAKSADLYELFGVIVKSGTQYMAYILKQIKKKNVVQWYLFEQDGYKVVKVEEVFAQKNVKLLFYKKVQRLDQVKLYDQEDQESYQSSSSSSQEEFQMRAIQNEPEKEDAPIQKEVRVPKLTKTASEMKIHLDNLEIDIQRRRQALHSQKSSLNEALQKNLTEKHEMIEKIRNSNKKKQNRNLLLKKSKRQQKRFQQEKEQSFYEQQVQFKEMFSPKDLEENWNK